jgi:hypothetical protein
MSTKQLGAWIVIEKSQKPGQNLLPASKRCLQQEWQLPALYRYNEVMRLYHHKKKDDWPFLKNVYAKPHWMATPHALGPLWVKARTKPAYMRLQGNGKQSLARQLLCPIQLSRSLPASKPAVATQASSRNTALSVHHLPMEAYGSHAPMCQCIHMDPSGCFTV